MSPSSTRKTPFASASTSKSKSKSKSASERPLLASFHSTNHNTYSYSSSSSSSSSDYDDRASPPYQNNNNISSKARTARKMTSNTSSAGLGPQRERNEERREENHQPRETENEREMESNEDGRTDEAVLRRDKNLRNGSKSGSTRTESGSGSGSGSRNGRGHDHTSRRSQQRREEEEEVDEEEEGDDHDEEEEEEEEEERGILARSKSWIITSWNKLGERYGAIELENKGSVARDHLALERTFLAWLRTSLAFASIGIAVGQLFRLNTTFDHQTSPHPHPHPQPHPPPHQQSPFLSPPPPPAPPPSGLGIGYRYEYIIEETRRAHKLARLGKPLGATFLAISIIILFIGFHRFFESQAWLMRGKFPASRFSIFVVTVIAAALIVGSLVLILVVDPTVSNSLRR